MRSQSLWILDRKGKVIERSRKKSELCVAESTEPWTHLSRRATSLLEIATSHSKRM